MCLVAQGMLLVVCATSFAYLTAQQTKGGEEEQVSAESYAQYPTADEDLVLTIENGGDSEKESEVKEEDTKPREESTKEDAEKIAEDANKAADKPASNTQTVSIYKAELKAPLEERVTDLLSKTTLIEGDVVHYERLLNGELLTFGEPYVLWRFDELAYLYWEALKAGAEKAKDGKLKSVRAKVDGDTLMMDLTVEFEVKNKLLKLMMGTEHEEATAHMEARLSQGGVTVTDMRVEGKKEYSESLMKLGSDFLFGTEDYRGYVSELVKNVTASLGVPYQASDVYYGVIFCTKRV